MTAAVTERGWGRGGGEMLPVHRHPEPCPFYVCAAGVQRPSAGSLQASASPFLGLLWPPALLHPGGAVLCLMFPSFLTPVIN